MCGLVVLLLHTGWLLTSHFHAFFTLYYLHLLFEDETVILVC